MIESRILTRAEARRIERLPIIRAFEALRLLGLRADEMEADDIAQFVRLGHSLIAKGRATNQALRTADGRLVDFDGVETAVNDIAEVAAQIRERRERRS